MTILSIIIVSYNTKQLLLDCIASIEKHNEQAVKTGAIEIIVVDNNSTDGSVQALQEQKTAIKKIVIIQNKTNEGFSKANNRGVKKAQGKYILFLNSDTLVYDQTLSTMISFMENNPKAGGATCEVLLPNGMRDDASHRGFPTPWNAFCHFSKLESVFPKTKLMGGYHMGWMDYTKIHPVDACAGAFLLVRKTAGDSIGWWDEDFFWYGDDLDFCFRLKEKEWVVYYVPQVRILHYKGVSGGLKKVSKHLTTADKKTRLNATNARFSAMKVFYTKHYTHTYPSWVKSLTFMAIDIFSFFQVVHKTYAYRN